MSKRKCYLFFDYYSDLLDSAVKLVEGDTSLVVDIEKLEAFSEVSLLCLRLCALLRHLGLKFNLEPTDK